MNDQEKVAFQQEWQDKLHSKTVMSENAWVKMTMALDMVITDVEVKDSAVMTDVIRLQTMIKDAANEVVRKAQVEMYTFMALEAQKDPTLIQKLQSMGGGL